MLGFGSIGEFAVGEYVVVESHDIPLLVTAENDENPLAPSINTGATIGVPTASMANTPQIPLPVSGGRVDMPVVTDTFTPITPSISRGTSIRPSYVMMDQLAYAPPIIRGGNSIYWASQDLIPNTTGSIGDGSIGEFAIGEGTLNYAIALRIPSMMISPRRPDIAGGKAIKPGTFSVEDLPYPLDINARARRLRSLGIAS